MVKYLFQRWPQQCLLSHMPFCMRPCLSLVITGVHVPGESVTSLRPCSFHLVLLDGHSGEGTCYIRISNSVGLSCWKDSEWMRWLAAPAELPDNSQHQPPGIQPSQVSPSQIPDSQKHEPNDIAAAFPHNILGYFVTQQL